MRGSPSELLVLQLALVVPASSPACHALGSNRAPLPAAPLPAQPLTPDDTLQGEGQPGGESIQPRCVAVERTLLLLVGCCTGFLCQRGTLGCVPSGRGWGGTWEENGARRVRVQETDWLRSTVVTITGLCTGLMIAGPSPVTRRVTEGQVRPYVTRARHMSRHDHARQRRSVPDPKPPRCAVALPSDGHDDCVQRGSCPEVRCPVWTPLILPGRSADTRRHHLARHL